MPRANAISSIIKQILALPLVILFITLGLLVRVQAQGPVVLTDEQDEYPLGLHLGILEDPTRQLTIEDVASPEFDRQFVPNQSPEFNLGLVDSVYWARFQVNNQTDQTNEWWLEIANSDINNIAVYYPHPDGRPGFVVKRADDPLAAHETSHYHTVFQLSLPPQSKEVIYLRVEDRRINLPMTLWSGTGFITESQKDFMIQGLYWGILFIMAGYNFFLFLTLRDKGYLFYVLFMLNLLLADIVRKYLPTQIQWPSQISVNTTIILLFIAALIFIFLLQFAATFLMTKTYAPHLHRILVGLQIGLGGIFLLWVMAGTTLLIVIWLTLVLLSMAMVFITALAVWRRGYRSARYFVLGLGMFLGAVFISIWAVLGFLPTLYIEYAVHIGIISMALLMSLALADRINIIKKEREQAEAETSQRNRELTLLNRVIAATTSAMEPETVLDAVCGELVRAFNLTHAIAVLASEDNSEIMVVADHHTEDQPSLLGYSFPVEGNPLLEHIVAHKEPLAVEDAQHDPRTASIRQLLRLRNTISLLMFPLIVENEAIGGINLSSNKPRRFSTDELNLVQSVAEQVTGALTRIRLIEERQQLEAQYYQTQKMDAIGSLAGGIAHDFNNLLVPIIGYVELAMVKLTANHELYRNLEHVYKAAERAAALTQQILAFSRKQVLEIKPVNLNDIITNFEGMMGRLIGEDIDLQTSLELSLHLAKVDRSQMEQILMNLAVNARDAMPNGGKLIIETGNVLLDEKYTESYAEVLPGPYVMVAVSDTGCGMDDETKRRIFEPFYTTKDQGKGTGLGLSTVHGIIKQHRGYIWVYSEPEVGTTFKIYLPQARETVPSKLSESEHVPLVGTETVLVVEDEEGVRNLVSGTLEAYGYQVLQAKNAEEGLQLASTSTHIDLLLTDVIMPGMNGRELYEQINAIRPQVKVLYMSGYTDNMIVRDGILEEGTNYLQKPFTIQGLTQKVRTVLS